MHPPERLPKPFQFAFVCLLLAGAVCSCSKTIPQPTVPTQFAPAAFEGSNAWKKADGLVAISPRISGTEGTKTASAWLRDQLLAAGVEARILPFEEPSADRGLVSFQNVEGRIPGNTSDLIIFGSHYDTKAGIPEFVGANDSGSSSGVLLELARALMEQKHLQENVPGLRPEIRFVFFDGEECFREYGLNDGFHGSLRYAKDLVTQGLSSQVLAVIVLDMIGDQDLSVTLPVNGAPYLTAGVLKAAHAEKVRERFSLYNGMIGDDHVAFLDRGMPAVDIIDFHFGSAPLANDYWHTSADTMDKLSTQSLESIGRISIRLLNEIMSRRYQSKI